MNEAYEKGSPLLRPMYIHFSDDPISFDNPFQFTLGRELIVAPVSEPDVSEISVYLPKGEWTLVWNQSKFSSNGTYFTVTSPIGFPPVFFPVGSEIGKEFTENLIRYNVIKL